MQEDKRELMDKLARRAKWRKRWQKWKTVIVAVTLLVVLVPSFLAFTPWAPQWYHDKVMEELLDAEAKQKDPKTKKVSPEAFKQLYDLAMFYSYTLRSDDAVAGWDELAKMRYGYSLVKWVFSDGQDKGKKAERLASKMELNAECDAYAGYAVARLAEYYDMKKHKGFALRLYEELYMKDFKGKPGEDPTLTEHGEIFIRNYHSGS